VYPALTVVAELRKQAAETPDRAAADPSAEFTLSAAEVFRTGFLYVGRADTIEARLAQRARIPFEPIQVGGVRGLAPWSAARNLWRVYRSVGRVRALIRDFKPTVIFATGGYVSAPVIWAGAAEHIPSVIYLPDLEPGWAIRATARWATRVAVSFPEVEKHFPRGKAVVTGYPVRAEFFQTDKAKARRKFHLDPDARTVAIFGGSTGAHHINQAAVANLADLTRLAQVVHITGRNDEAWVNGEMERLSGELRARVRIFGYLDDDLPHALAAADVVVARAGAATLGEFPVLGLPAILVPYPYAGMHQERNARFLVERGAAVKVDDAGLGRDLIPTLRSLLDAPEKIKKMSDSMRALAQPRAVANIVALLRSLEI
jgi:UDP-N-acetylglucosamine--N-acetylmuramyl-(pentapeptide) pyrophosphoryl-undecaprenol N-acetylglucosamine transferase